MAYERFGVIAFFGIFIPGAYLTGIIILGIASLFEFLNIGGHARLLDILRNNIVILSTVIFLISYFFGVILRLFAPRYAESLSTFYLKHLRRKKEIWATDVFPYAESLSERLKTDGIFKVLELIENLNKFFGVKNNTLFFNFCKMFITANNSALSKQIYEAEAFTRFLSGTTLALVIALIIFTVLTIFYYIYGMLFYAHIYIVFFAISLLFLFLILEHFKNQRKREVVLVWISMYLIVKGGTQPKIEDNSQQFIKSVFF